MIFEMTESDDLSVHRNGYVFTKNFTEFLRQPQRFRKIFVGYVDIVSERRLR